MVFIVRREIMTHVINNHYDLLPSIWGQDRCLLALTGLYGGWKQLIYHGYRHILRHDSVSMQHFSNRGMDGFNENIAKTKRYILEHLK